MKKLLIIAGVVFFCLGLHAETYRYKDQQKSLIDWDNIDPLSWLDLNEWKRDAELKTEYPDWLVSRRDKTHREIIGRVLQCVGNCINEKRDGSYKVGYPSKIYEANEFRTEGESYAWIFLYDGTMVRLSPNSSVTFNEFNVANDELFVFARINYGNVLWLRRNRGSFNPTSMRETDAIFLPLPIGQSGIGESEIGYDENNLYGVVERNDEKLKYEKLNRLIAENNKNCPPKVSQYFLVMPNGMIANRADSAEFIVLPGVGSYFKKISFTRYNKSYTSKGWLDFIEVGYKKIESIEIRDNNWYKLDFSGRDMVTYPDGERRFAFGGLLTKRIPSIMIAREMMFKKYSIPFHQTNIKPRELARKYGYRLWNHKRSGTMSETEKRLKYLRVFTRRLELTNLKIFENYIKMVKREGRELVLSDYSPIYFRKALHAYSVKKESEYWQMAKGDRKVLNSMKKRFWRTIHERKK